MDRVIFGGKCSESDRVASIKGQEIRAWLAGPRLSSDET
jgi:hypothetical protein